jgi:hypothetical protein
MGQKKGERGELSFKISGAMIVSVSRTFTSRLVSRLARVAASFGVSFFLNKSILYVRCFLLGDFVFTRWVLYDESLIYSWCSLFRR